MIKFTEHNENILVNSLSATSISATTYFGLPVDVSVAGGTFNSGTTIFTNNTGGTFSVTGFSSNSGLTSALSTGVYVFSGLSIASPTTFNVAPVSALIIDSTNNLTPVVLQVSYSGGVHTGLFISSTTETYVFMTSAGTISQQITSLTEKQRRQNVFLGKLGHANFTTIINTFSQPDFIQSPLSQLRDMFEPIKFINSGVYPSANTGFTLNTSSGKLHGLSINFSNDSLNPDVLTINSNNPVTFQYRTQTGGTASNTTLIDPTSYDLNGLVTAIPGTKTTNQRIYLIQNGVFRIQYGQVLYSNLSAAIAGLATENFVTFKNFTDLGLLIGVLSVTSNASNLNNPVDAQIFFASKFGETVGSAGGFSTSTLQQAYNNSMASEITTDSIRGALTVKRGTALDTDNVFEIFNGDGQQTMVINGTGAVRIGLTGSTPPISNLEIAGSGGSDSFIVSTRYADNTLETGLIVRKARGTISSPTGILANDRIGGFASRGYHSGGAFATGSTGAIIITAAETYTSTAQGTYIQFQTTTTGSTSLSEKMRLSYNGNLSIGSTGTTSMFNVGTSNQFKVDSTGNVSATTVSATTYYGLPIDVSITGGTYSSGTTVFTNNTGGTFSVTGVTSKFQTTLTTPAANVTNIITHNLGTTDISVSLWLVTTGDLTSARITNRTTNTVSVIFSSAPGENIRVVVLG